MSKKEILTIPSEHDGLKLSVATIVPEGAPKGLVQFAHGMAEHKERYFPLMEYLAQQGFACVINDHRGHGASVKSYEDLGYFYKDGGRALVKDMHQINVWFKKQYPKLPMTLVGHSMGSLAARAYAAQYGREIDKLILSGSPGYQPAVKVALALSKILAVVKGQHARSPFINRLLNGSFAKAFPGGSEFAWLSRNAENVANYEADPLCGFGFTINGNRALLHLMIAAYDERNGIRKNLPVHFMSGEDDPCAPNRAGFDAAIENMRRRGCAHVTGVMYPGLRHEIFNEGDLTIWEDLLSALPG